MNLSEIRVHIDEIDQEMRKLFIKRMALAEQVVTVKSETGDKIFKPDREKDIIIRNSKEVDSRLEHEYQAMVKRIMEVSRKYQYSRMLELRDSFPFSYETGSCDFKRLAVLSKDADCRSLFHAEHYLMTDGYEEMAKLLSSHEVDAGIAIMEEVGAGVSEEFHRFLSDGHYYINDCVVTQGDSHKKCVLFSNRLIVCPEHNRFKIMFMCHNHAGSYATLLSMISDYQINISQMHSSPVMVEKGWDYRFYLELEGNIATKDIKSLIFQLSEESSFFEILGSYHCEGDFV